MPTADLLKHEAVLSKLDPALRAILDAELAAGNKISDVSERAWPMENGITVSLVKRFAIRIETLPPTVSYFELNDPHYWKAEIKSLERPQLLICGFEQPRQGLLSSMIGRVAGVLYPRNK